MLAFPVNLPQQEDFFDFFFLNTDYMKKVYLLQSRRFGMLSTIVLHKITKGRTRLKDGFYFLSKYLSTDTVLILYLYFGQ